ncbi:glutathione S-transferase [Sphingobium sp. SYK-6]|uniref:glutathione S-transferase family protein n=1 Tax=Sphingobium sp. (strain NBRC 103272 / SYK-6) TaxID=627192 RepID=UPI0002276FB4|nr:glutathione S-transferase family protein [Sphingobium sp. SYK-6]BAK67981.1 glutathione S-transferase [Sphingobium sp. SYK-6]
MTAAIQFYTNPMSRGQIIRWMLEELGQPYETHLLDYAGSMKSPDYLALNPMGKVPAIVHDGKIVTECAAICVYLAECFPEASLGPRPEERADYYRWLFFAAGPVEAAVTNQAAGFTVSEERARMFGYGTYDLAMQTLESAVTGRDYVCGPRFTAADVYVGSQIDWGLQFGTMPDRPAFRAYAEQLRARPAYQRAKDIDNALIAQMKGAAEKQS